MFVVAQLIGSAAVVCQSPDAPASSDYLLDRARAKAQGSAADRREAEQLYCTVLEMPSRWQYPAARVGLAELARIRGELGVSLTHLRAAAAELDLHEGFVKSQPAESAAEGLNYVRWTRMLWHAELARSHLALGLVDQAERSLEQQLELLQQTGDVVDRLDAAQAAIDLALGRGDFARARVRSERALADKELLGDEPAVRDGLLFRRMCAQVRLPAAPAERVRLAEAFDDLLASGTLDPSLRMRAELDRVAAWLGAREIARAVEWAELLVRELPGQPLLDAELLAMHARVLLAADSSSDRLIAARDRLETAVTTLFEAWAQLPLRGGGIGSLQFDGRRDVLSTLLRLERRIGGPDAVARAFWHLERAYALGTLSRRLGTAPVTHADLRRSLSAGSAGALLCFLAPSGAHVLAIDGAGAVHVEFDADPEFHAGLVQLTKAVDDQPKGDAPAAIVKLRATSVAVAARLLPEAVAARVRTWRRMLVIGEQVPAAVWHALPWGESWLCLQLPIRHVPSAAMAEHLHARHRARPRREPRLDLAVIGGPEPAPAFAAQGLAPIVVTAEDRRALLGNDGRSRGWFDAEANAGAFALPAVQQAHAVCLLAHGVQDFQRERYAGVLLAPLPARSPVMFADELESCGLPALVVLGTCGAAAGPQRVGDDGVAHLGGACLAGGADAVVLAGGALSLGASVDLLVALFGGMRAGEDVGTALWRARREVAARPARQHPYYYAGLRHLGADVGWR